YSAAPRPRRSSGRCTQAGGVRRLVFPAAVVASGSRPVLRAGYEAAANRSRHANLTGDYLKNLQLARRPGGRAPRDDDPLAPRRLETVLSPEVSAWPTTDSPTITGSGDGSSQGTDPLPRPALARKILCR